MRRHPHRLTADADRGKSTFRRVPKAAISQNAAHLSLRFSSICRLLSAVSTDVSTTFRPRYTRSTPAREITSEPWITTPEFSTWSRISRRETSSSPPPRTPTVSKSFCIRDKRVRRPRPIYFDAPLPVPPLYKILQHLVPLLAFGARHQKGRLPKQVGLRSAYFAAGRGIRRNLGQRGCQFL